MHIYASTSMSVTKIIQALNLSRINTVHGSECGGIHHFMTQKFKTLKLYTRQFIRYCHKYCLHIQQYPTLTVMGEGLQSFTITKFYYSQK
jgi:hypothetical protein